MEAAQPPREYATDPLEIVFMREVMQSLDAPGIGTPSAEPVGAITLGNLLQRRMQMLERNSAANAC
jgi:hypothetical protein